MSTAARIDELRRKFEENPRRYFAPLANEYRKAGELGQAIALCREHLPKQPGHMSGYIVFGQALYESGSLGEARTVFEQALALDPENLIALRHLGDIAKASGDAVVARRWYERVLDADPRNDDIAAQLASLASIQAAARLTPQSSAQAIPHASSISSPAVPSFGLGAMPTPDATLRAVDFDVVNKRMARYTPLDLDAIEADGDTQPLAGDPDQSARHADSTRPSVPQAEPSDASTFASASAHPESELDYPSMESAQERKSEPDTETDPFFGLTEHAAAAQPESDTASGEITAQAWEAHPESASTSGHPAHSSFDFASRLADQTSHAATFEREDDIDPAEHVHPRAEDDVAVAHAASSNVAESIDELLVEASPTESQAHDASRSVHDALGAFALYDPTDELQSDRYAAESAEHVDAEAAYPSQTPAASHDPVDAASTHEVVASLDAEVFEEGLVAPEWPVAAELIAQVATPRFFFPHVIHPTPDAIAAFGREPYEPAEPTIDHDDVVHAEGPLEIDEHVHSSIGMEAEAFGVHAESESDAEQSADTHVLPASAHHGLGEHAADESLIGAVDHFADATASQSANDFAERSDIEIVDLPLDVSAEAANGDDESPVYESAAEETSLPWLSAPDEIGFSADSDRAANEIAAMFESDARASGDDSAVTVASLETFHPLPEPVLAEASFADVGTSEEDDDYEEAAPSAASPAFVTETMAELLVSQGFTARAVGVYEELVLRHPYDPVLASRLAELRKQLDDADPTNPVIGSSEGDSTSAFGLPSTNAMTPAFGSAPIPVSATPRFDAPVSATPAFGAPAAGTPALPTPAQHTPAYPTPAYFTPAYSTPAYPSPAFPTPTYATPMFAAALPSSPDTPATGSPLVGTPAYGSPPYGTPAYGILAGAPIAFATPSGSAPAVTSQVMTARERFARLAARRVPRRTPAVATPVVHETPDGLASLFGGGESVATDDTAARAFADAFAPMPEASANATAFLDFDQRDAAPAAAAVQRRAPTPRSAEAQLATPTSGSANAGFSFDRFFPDPAIRNAPPASTTPAGDKSTAEPPTPVGDDLAQFSAWLKGLGTT